jgi:hypothetical protein
MLKDTREREREREKGKKHLRIVCRTDVKEKERGKSKE